MKDIIAPLSCQISKFNYFLHLRNNIDIYILNNSLMKALKIIKTILATIVALTVNSCEERDGVEIRYDPWFPGTETTQGMMTIVVPANGGEVTVPTRLEKAPLEYMISNVSVSGDRTRDIEIQLSENSKYTKCFGPETETDQSAFDWCNPTGQKLYIHEWLGVWQEPYNLHLCVQPNPTSETRSIHVIPVNELTIYGFLTVTQEGAAE